MLVTFHRILENLDEKSVLLKWELCVGCPVPILTDDRISTSAHKWLVFGEIKQVDFFEVRSAV